jgi:hypothetical protein
VIFDLYIPDLMIGLIITNPWHKMLMRSVFLAQSYKRAEEIAQSWLLQSYTDNGTFGRKTG